MRAGQLSVHTADNFGLRGSDLRHRRAGAVGLHLKPGEQIGQRLPLCGMLGRHSIHVDAHQPVEQHHRIGAPEPEAHYLLILADDGEIHPGPTIYDSFWIRDSSVRAIACALAGDVGLAGSQLGKHHLEVFQAGTNWIGPARAYGFFGGQHEQDNHEWDANGEALWAFGKFDRTQGPRGLRCQGVLALRAAGRLDPGQPRPGRHHAQRLERRAHRRREPAALLGRSGRAVARFRSRPGRR
jgi:hypothetical protein